MEKNDIHKVNETFESTLDSLEKTESISKEDKKRIKQFIEDSTIGKNARSKVGKSRLIAYIEDLKILSRHFKKPFLKLTEKDLTNFYLDLERDKIRRIDGKRYKGSSKNEFIKSLKKFGRWLYKDDKAKYDEVFGWLKNFREDKEIPALSKEEVDNLVKTSGTRDAALLMFLFDAGARAEELLNIRLEDLREEQVGKDLYYKVRIKVSKTKPRTISIPLATPYIKNWMAEHPNSEDKSSFLFPITYDYLRKILYRKGKQLKKRIYPHLLRHSSATYYANRLTQYHLCYRYGWAMASTQPQRYIDRNGIEEEKTAEIIKYDETSKLRKENQLLKEDIQKLKESDKIIAEKLVNLLNFFKSNPQITKQLSEKREMMEIFT